MAMQIFTPEKTNRRFALLRSSDRSLLRSTTSPIPSPEVRASIYTYICKGIAGKKESLPLPPKGVWGLQVQVQIEDL